MSRTYVKGWYFDPESPARFTRGWACIDNGRAIETSKAAVSMPGGPVINGIALPAVPNGHTHLGDFMLHDEVRPGMTVEELVAPPHGLKHRLLGKIDVTESITRALNVMKANGTGHFCDFREGGLRGIEDMARAMVSGGRGLKGTILGRPAGLTYDRDEVDGLLEGCDGIGISGIGDWDKDELGKLARHVKGKGKVLALHVSEARREDIDMVLDLAPSFVVHMTMASKGDLHRLSTLGIPVVACPRSNLFYGRRPPLRAMLDADVQVCIGTDNAMMSDLSVFGELKAARDLGLSPEETWGMVEGTWKLLNRDYGMHMGAADLRWIAIGTTTDGPMAAITGTGSGICIELP